MISYTPESGNSAVLEAQDSQSRVRAATAVVSERYRAIFNQSFDAILIEDDGRIIEWNPAATRLFNTDGTIFAGRSVWEFSPITQPCGIASALRAEALRNFALAGEAQIFDWTFELPDGKTRPTRVSLQCIAPRVLQLIVHDTSEERRFARRLAEKNRELEQALSLRSRFLAVMSHELRTPLNAIIGLTGILAMKLAGPLTTGQEKHLQGIHSSALHLLSIINDMLDLTRLETGRIELHLERVDPFEMVQEVTAALRPLASEKALEFALASDGTLRDIRTDRRTLKQILFNLISNALKYTDSGSVSVTVRSDEQHVYFRVADTGPGIAPEHQASLFREFGRIPNGSKQDGSGLGLYLSQKLAALLGGSILFENATAGGSVFTLILKPGEVLA